ncbi:MAG: DUF424 family protein [Candidatus Pacearchaeota archaeon]
MIVNIIESYRDVIAICDKNLLGKRFEEGKFQLHIKESFYKGKEKSENEVLEIIKNMAKEDATFNIVGEKSVNVAIKAGIINENSVGEIQGIKFALVLL